jgi:Asp-tRNA(Asn)/Glu-tRNA(Gln) amidotransferase A subunit family amidase
MTELTNLTIAHPRRLSRRRLFCARSGRCVQRECCGVPIGMKDLFATKGVQTTAASHILEGFKPEYESTVSQKLWDAGAGCWASSTWTSSPWAPPTRRAISAM